MIRTTINYLIYYIPNFLTGLIASIAGYFAPIRGMVIVMLAAIVIDLFSGIWAARTEGEAIQSKKLWRTAYKTLFALVIVHLLHSVDKEMGIPGISTCKIGALFLTGFEVWSILENAAVVSDHPVFRALKRLMQKKVKDETGVNLEE